MALFHLCIDGETMTEAYQTEIDYLAIGLTRPPVFMGINIRLFFSNLVLSTLVCINAHTFWGVPLFIFLHLIMVKLSIKEPNFLYIYFKFFFKTPPVLNFWYWGKTNSYSAW